MILKLIYNYKSDHDDYELYIYNESNKIVKIKGKILPKNVAVFNDTNFIIKDIKKDFELEFSMVYLVSQSFEYSDFWGPKAGRATIIEQIVVLTEEYKQLFILIDSGHLIS